MHALEDICSYTERMTALRLKHGWDPDDTNLYLDHQQRYSPEGLASYWNAVDKTIEEYNRNYFDKADSPIDNNAENYNRNEYKWQSPTYINTRRPGGRRPWRGGRY